MKVSTLILFIKYALKNIRRNVNAAISIIASVMLTLFVLGVFLLFVLNAKIGIIYIGSQPEIRVNLKCNINSIDEKKIYNKISASNSVTFFSLENDNPLSVSYLIKVNKSKDMPKIISQVKGLKGINKINSGQSISREFLVTAKIIQWVGIILFPIFVLAAFFLIKNTIRLALYSRRNEISIMKYIGAADQFIVGPFIFEGIIIGFLGAVSAVILLYLFYSFIYRYYLVAAFSGFISPSFIFTAISWSFILIGIILNTIGTILVVRKYLIEK
ncbi:MAG: FtsX-like permease family protein [Clostridium sp.]|nr:FtsX-like permease family protein [Clostridium sp.]